MDRNSWIHKLNATNRPSLFLTVVLVIAIAVLGALSVRQHEQIQDLRELNGRSMLDQTCKTDTLSQQLDSLERNFQDQRAGLRQVGPASASSEIQEDKKTLDLLRLQQSLQALSAKVQQLSDQVQADRQNGIPDELCQQLQQLSAKVEQSQCEVAQWVQHDKWAEQIVEKLSGGVCLIQGEYTFVDPKTKLPLRYRNPIPVAGMGEWADVGQDGVEYRPEQQNDLGMAVSVTGKGGVLQVQYTGTGFLLDRRGYILTNRHVTAPWMVSQEYKHVLAAGYEGRLKLFRAFFPGYVRTFELKVVESWTEDDLALLSCDMADADIPALPCETDLEGFKAGQSVIVLGYPTGFDALLARLGEQELKALIDDPGMSFEQVGGTLARRGLIQPIGTRGMCGRVSSDRIVYDAQTAIGGSGAPVIGSKGQVVGINTALLRGFSGTNFGIPIRKGLDLLSQVLAAEASTYQAAADGPAGM